MSISNIKKQVVCFTHTTSFLLSDIVVDRNYLLLPVRVDDERELLAFSLFVDLLADELLVVALRAGAELTFELLLLVLLLEEAALWADRAGVVLLAADLAGAVLRLL